MALRVVRPKEAAQRIGVSRATLYRYVASGALPKPRRISPGVSGWLEETIDAFIREAFTETGETFKVASGVHWGSRT